MNQAVSTAQAPAAIGPYSQAVLAGGFLFASGQIPLDPATGAIVEGGIEAQTHRVLQNLKAVVEEAGLSLGDVVKTTIFLDSMDDFAKVNEIYASYFDGGVLPARATVQVGKLPKNALVEIDCVAHRG
ncbi:RidA family protein [Cohnella ginsengisoli]|uniref:RidA family protein n=1 Tax=Cohnella ginsengisoli TaxID=425004 RepID=A0A9X4KMB2_9BACL|nr:MULTISPECIES: RidA family protein [Cohnella]MDG0794954.1 RidA family protein [Cohnella ginsengisoli]SFB56416.1 endoribonuclease L-PSP [Cohnella sp. OV330]